VPGPKTKIVTSGSEKAPLQRIFKETRKLDKPTGMPLENKKRGKKKGRKEK